ncbi:MAG TPA: helix-turn-helix transcriptional regulator [Candidatus Limnocylindrales bacterium]
MADTAIERLAASRGRALRRMVAGQLEELREERGLSQREVAGAAGVDRSWLARAEAGDANLTLHALAAIATVLGTEASVRLYPSSGPRLRDHIQVRLIETLLDQLHPRWRPRLEVPVYRPVRGVIDLVLTDRAASELVAAEAHSEIRRAERQLRWAFEKADALPSAVGWPWMDRHPLASRLLILRSTDATRAVVRAAPHVFGAAYPGRTAEAVAALTGAAGTVPDAAIVWIDVLGSASRLLAAPPRGIDVGR